jgi:hypothetical protein
VLWDFTRLPECEVAVEAAGPKPQPLVGAACDRFAYVLILPARHPGAIFDRPMPLVPEFVAEAPRDAAGWEPMSDADLCLNPPLPKEYPPVGLGDPFTLGAA